MSLKYSWNKFDSLLLGNAIQNTDDFFFFERWGIHYFLLQHLITFTVLNLFIGLIPVCVDVMSFSACKNTNYLSNLLFISVKVLTNCSQVISQAFISNVKCELFMYLPDKRYSCSFCDSFLQVVQFHQLNFKVSGYDVCHSDFNNAWFVLNRKVHLSFLMYSSVYTSGWWGHKSRLKTDLKSVMKLLPNMYNFFTTT